MANSSAWCWDLTESDSESMCEMTLREICSCVNVNDDDWSVAPQMQTEWTNVWASSEQTRNSIGAIKINLLEEWPATADVRCKRVADKPPVVSVTDIFQQTGWAIGNIFIGLSNECFTIISSGVLLHNPSVCPLGHLVSSCRHHISSATPAVLVRWWLDCWRNDIFR